MLISCLTFVACKDTDADTPSGGDNVVVFADAEGKSIFTITFDGDKVVSLVNLLKLNSEEEANILLETYKEHSEMCAVEANGSEFTMTYTPEYIDNFYNGKTRAEIVENYKNNGYIEQ